jgi:hypothetical protein
MRCTSSVLVLRLQVALLLIVTILSLLACLGGPLGSALQGLFGLLLIRLLAAVVQMPRGIFR